MFPDEVKINLLTSSGNFSGVANTLQTSYLGDRNCYFAFLIMRELEKYLPDSCYGVTFCHLSIS